MQSSANSRILSLRYDGKCAVCESQLPRRTRAWWFPATKKMVCVACKPEQDKSVVLLGSGEEAVEPTAEADDASVNVAQNFDGEEPMEEQAPLLSDGEAGASARREGERRRAKREREVLDQHPYIGKLILSLSDEPQRVRSWSKGAVGEEALGARLTRLASERHVVLHDRRVPGSRANIDHIAIAPGGVFVIDSKHYSGRVQKRDLGGWFHSDQRLYVGRRDCTKLVLASEDQAEVVRDAIAPLDLHNVPVRPVLCFIGAEWGLFASPFKHGSVLVTWPKFLYELVRKEAAVETTVIQETARHLADVLPNARN